MCVGKESFPGDVLELIRSAYREVCVVCCHMQKQVRYECFYHTCVLWYGIMLRFTGKTHTHKRRAAV